VATGADFRVTEFTHRARLNLAAEALCHPLHAITNAQHRHAEFKQRRISLVVTFVYRIRAAAEDNALGAKGLDVFQRHVERVQFAVNVRFAYAAGDQLGDLRTEVEDENFVHAVILSGRVLEVGV
jgi:hypothetical protein